LPLDRGAFIVSQIIARNPLASNKDIR
jgi:hypothetical protein